MYARLAGLKASMAFPVSVSHPAIGVMGLLSCAIIPGFVIPGSEDFHSGPHACVARTLPFQPSP